MLTLPSQLSEALRFTPARFAVQPGLWAQGRGGWCVADSLSGRRLSLAVRQIRKVIVRLTRARPVRPVAVSSETDRFMVASGWPET
jgi:hypothetical protein